MELLIPGLILVAIMVYASTRIKRSAARAFEAETIETDEFIIQKPDGFLNVIGGDSKFAFEAYSKDYGGDDAEGVRLATANVIVKKDTTIETVAAELLNSSSEIIDDRSEKTGGISYRMIEHRVTDQSVDFRVQSKLAQRDGNVFIFTIKVVAETTSDFMHNIKAMFDSFRLK
jgi:hypothetical protein